MIIREATVKDAEQLSTLMADVEQSNMMLFAPGERKFSVDQQRKRMEQLETEETSSIFVAEDNNNLVGYLFAIGNSPSRIKHRVYIVVGVSAGYRGKGIGFQLFSRLEEWAKKLSIRRLELTVIEHNEAAVSLYKKMGFEVEGVKRDSLKIDGEFVNELYMSKLLSY